MWCEVASPGAIQGAMTDGLVEIIGVSCIKLLLSDDVSMGRVSSNGLIPGLDLDLGRPQHFTKRDFRICGQFMHYRLGVQLGLRNLTRALKELTTSSSLNSILNRAMSEESVRDRVVSRPRRQDRT